MDASDNTLFTPGEENLIHEPNPKHLGDGSLLPNNGLMDFIENIFDHEGPFGEADCAGI